MINASFGAPWQRAAPLSVRAVPLRWQRLVLADARSAGLWGSGRPLARRCASGWSGVPVRDAGWGSGWEHAEQRNAAARSAWDSTRVLDVERELGWDRTLRPRDRRLSLIYNPRPSPKDAGRPPGWRRSAEFDRFRDALSERRASLYIPTGLLDFNFGPTRYTPANTPDVFFDFRYVAPVRSIRPVDAGARSSYGSPARFDALRRIPWAWGRPTDPVPTGIVYPDYPGPVVPIDPPTEPEILETYMIGNTVTLVVLPSRTPLDATSIRIGLDIDSFAWSFSADLFGRTSLDLTAPDANGPKTVELEINGWTWRFLVERYSGSGKHPSERYTISGASRTQLLDAPYAPKRSAVNTAPLNARQVVDDQLQYTGFSVSWDVENMGPPDWTLPAGAFSYQDQTPMQVIVKLAEVAGGIVRPGLMDDSVTILPRYREATWYWDTAIPDRIIPAAIVAEWGSEWSPQPAWNFVYVSGTSYGVSVQVRRAGTAGEESAPDVMEDWMTGTEVARSRGICELSKGGNQAIETRRIPLFQKDDGVPGLVQPGMLVEVRDEQATWRGLCLATDISAEGVGASRVWQTLRIERHYPGGS
ncbi:hypothetical protein [Pseudomonas aeruginosa]|uniref:hypothetical protein n=1 Tax=Pseudomonas aeruginosa TaxID=287 RepID=UPI000D6887E4|nr:hypothetical protein [Pseudomonas aeruginosa]